MSSTGVRLLRGVGTSALLVLPCAWRSLVTPVDLQSHLYNAWLTKLISEGAAPGLYVTRQYSNVLMDVLLAWGLRHVGVSPTERVSCAALVLLFFWGAFCFLRETSGKAPWWAAPWIAIFTYGLVFQLGFLNYYASTALVFWALAVAWRGDGRRLAASLPLLALAAVAHPLPVACFAGIIACALVSRRLSRTLWMAFFVAGVAAIAIAGRIILATVPSAWKPQQFAYVLGADQALLYGASYAPVSAAMLLLFAALAMGRARDWREQLGPEVLAWGMTAALVAFIPYEIGRASVISQRLSLFAGVLALASLKQPRWPRAALAFGMATAALFFALLYRDLGTMGRIEARIAGLVSSAPPGARIVTYLPSPPCSRIPLQHLTSRACINRCFDFENYEPATDQFRIHARPGNRVAEADIVKVKGLEAGLYPVQAGDLPLSLIHRCGAGLEDLCMRDMHEGDRGIDLSGALAGDRGCHVL
jgi:hypothetical protein